ncbi:hydrolase [Pectobacterium sp. CHL-2024]|uniref:hydrolase n=1 Tax=Pectobacterium sp. CHL-2024 TaxID=3377079 RepID=UPI0037FA03F8
MATGPSPKLLTPQNSAIVLIDHQPQMYFGVESHDPQKVMNGVAALAETAKAFKVPTVLTSITATGFAGPLDPGITQVFPNAPIIDRTAMNAWEDAALVKAVKATSRKKLVMAGLWTEVCLTLPVLSAIDEGYDVYIVVDASGGSSKESHDAAVQRMVQAGAHPVTWMQVLYEYQRDWSRQETYQSVIDIAQKHGGAHGLGIFYAKSMFNAQEGKK